MTHKDAYDAIEGVLRSGPKTIAQVFNVLKSTTDLSLYDVIRLMHALQHAERIEPLDEEPDPVTGKWQLRSPVLSRNHEA